MDLTNFRYMVDADGIALATWDMPGRSMNVITVEVMDELSRIVDEVTGNAAIKGCVIASGKDSFSGGADLTMLQGLRHTFETMSRDRGEEEAMRVFFEESRRLTLLYRRIETSGKPFAIARAFAFAFLSEVGPQAPSPQRANHSPGTSPITHAKALLVR